MSTFPPHTDPIAREGVEEQSRIEYQGGPAVELSRSIRRCEACTMRQEASFPTPFWPRTDPSTIMMVGRNPGINEDKIGLPFVGRGGQLFQSWLRGLEISRGDIWLTNLCKCYTTADRKPKKTEITTCWKLHLANEIRFCQPHLIVAMGAEAFAATTGHDKLTQRHGILYDRRAQLNAYVMGVIHPGSALRDPSYRTMMVKDGMSLKPLLHYALTGVLLKEGPPANYEAM